jgi:predicted transcriptional regulator of viral defense system
VVALAPQAYEQFALHGLLVGSASDWDAAGVPRNSLEALVAAGKLTKVRRGAYATRAILDLAAGEPGLAYAIKAAAVRAAGKHDNSVVSHESAALMHGLDLLGDPPGTSPGLQVSLVVPPGTRTGRHKAADVSVHVAEVPAKHREDLFFGVPVTTAARTAVDIARTSPFMQGVVAADSALRARVATTRAIDRVLTDCRRWPGMQQARKVAAFATNLSESVLESCARVVFYEHGLPPPVLQLSIRGGTGTVLARADFSWPEYGTIADAEGMAKFDGAEGKKAMAKHLKRDSLLQELGWENVHFTWADLFGEPDRVVGRLRASFARGRQLGREAELLPGSEPKRAW